MPGACRTLPLKRRDLDLVICLFSGSWCGCVCIIEQAARCVYATLPLTLLLVQVEVIVVVACEYSFGYLVDCAIDPFAALVE